MSIITIINFLLIAGVIQGFLFNLITLLLKKKYSKVIVFLNFTVLFLSLNNLQAWIRENDFSCNLFFIKQLEVPWYVLIFPFFYVFLVHFLKVSEKVKDYVKLTIFIFFIEVVLRIGLIFYIKITDSDLDDTLINRFTSFEEIINLIYCLYIFIQAFYLVFKRRELFKVILSFDDVKWIENFLKISGVILALWVVAVAFYNLSGNRDAYILLRFATSIVLYWIGYQGLYRYNVVHDRIMLRRSLTNEKPNIYSDGLLKASDKKVDFYNDKHYKEFKIISDFIINEQKYLDPNLTMDQLSKELNISTSHFSKLINGYSDYNFPDYINSLRIEQAKVFLCNHAFEQYTIVAIGLECGFNSKSTFYSAFKKFTLQTPTLYREQSK